MGQELGQDGLGRGLRVGDRGHRLIPQIQRLPPAGAVPVDLRGGLPQPADKVGAVVDDHRPALGHPQGEVVQGVQQGGVLPGVLQNPGLVLVEPLVLRQGLGVPGPELADAAVQKPPPDLRPLPDQVQVLRAK